MADSIFNDMPAPNELVEYHYRKIFGLSSLEMQDEPLDKFFINLKIAEFENKKLEEIRNNINKDG